MLNNIMDIPASGDVVESVVRDAPSGMVWLVTFKNGKEIAVHFDAIDFSPAGEICSNTEAPPEENRRLVKFKSAFQRIAFTHGVALCEHDSPDGTIAFVFRVGRMRTPGRLDDAEIRQLEVRVNSLEIERSGIEPGDLARMKFTEVFTKLSAL